MLVLKRRRAEAIAVGPDIRVEVLRVEGEWVFLGVTAPPQLRISRSTTSRADLEAALAAINELLAQEPETLTV